MEVESFLGRMGDQSFSHRCSFSRIRDCTCWQWCWSPSPTRVAATKKVQFRWADWVSGRALDCPDVDYLSSFASSNSGGIALLVSQAFFSGWTVVTTPCSLIHTAALRFSWSDSTRRLMERKHTVNQQVHKCSVMNHRTSAFSEHHEYRVPCSVSQLRETLDTHSTYTI